MATLTVRIRDASHRALRDIADRTGQSMQEVLDRAIEEHRRRVLLDEANLAFELLRKNPKAWDQELKERAAWDTTLRDGIEEE